MGRLFDRMTAGLGAAWFRPAKAGAPTALLLALAAGLPSGAAAGTITLGFGSLPSAQGFALNNSCGVAETAMFSLPDSATLHQDTSSCSSSGAASYAQSNVVGSGAFSITARMRVIEESVGSEADFGHFALGFGAEANGFEYFIGIGSGIIDAVVKNGDNAAKDTTVVKSDLTSGFHTYELDAPGDGTFTLKLDGAQIFAGDALPTDPLDNLLFFGNASSRAHGIGDITEFVYEGTDTAPDAVPEPASSLLLGAGLGSLLLLRRRRSRAP
jgi:hypothetical protein